MSALIEIRDLQKTYGEGDSLTHALRGVSARIERGEFVAIMGPSGSGKSTLLQMLGLLDTPTAGSYIFDGRETATRSEDETARIRNERMGFVFQSFNLLPRTSVLENVKLPLLYSRIPEHEWDARAREAIAAVGLTHRIEHEPAQLSGGERQRVAIARALVCNPDVIFADEPTGNLDSKSGTMVMELLEQLHAQQGHTIILITHDEHTARFAKRRIIIRDGLMVADPADQVYGKK